MTTKTGAQLAFEITRSDHNTPLMREWCSHRTVAAAVVACGFHEMGKLMCGRKRVSLHFKNLVVFKILLFSKSWKPHSKFELEMNAPVQRGSERIGECALRGQIGWSGFFGFTMSFRTSFFRWRIAALMFIAAGPQLVSAGRAAEAATIGTMSVDSVSRARIERTRLAARLASSGFVLVGEPRRKGQFVVLNAMKQGNDWRLVVDGVTGDIIGKKPVIPMIAVSQ